MVEAGPVRGAGTYRSILVSLLIVFAYTDTYGTRRLVIRYLLLGVIDPNRAGFRYAWIIGNAATFLRSLFDEAWTGSGLLTAATAVQTIRGVVPNCRVSSDTGSAGISVGSSCLVSLRDGFSPLRGVKNLHVGIADSISTGFRTERAGGVCILGRVNFDASCAGQRGLGATILLSTDRYD